jgi:Methyltransferase domain
MKTHIHLVLVAGFVTAVLLMKFGRSLDRMGLVLSNDDAQNEAQVEIRIRNDICPDSKRFGRGNEGGWFVCDPKALTQAKPCIVYSFGIKDDFSFDQAMHEMGCQIHGFDPSPYGLASKSSYEAIGGEYHSFGLGLPDAQVLVAPFRWPGIGYLRDRNTDPWVLKRIPTIMKELGHSSMTYLKVDVEGSEWDAIDDIIAAKWGEFAVEMHFPPKEYVIDTKTDGMVIITRGDTPFQEPAVPAWLNRIALVKKLLAVADVWKVEPNAHDKQCMNVYFKMR